MAGACASLSAAIAIPCRGHADHGSVPTRLRAPAHTPLLLLLLALVLVLLAAPAPTVTVAVAITVTIAVMVPVIVPVAAMNA